MIKGVAVMITLVGTGLLVGVSRRSLSRPRSHGFFRFFAFEALLCLIVLNAGHWFVRPGAPTQLVSWLLLIASLLLAIHGFYLLHAIGKPEAPDPGSAALRFESTTTLVTVGAYRFIRHPLYASLLLGAWGTVLKHPSLLTVMLGATVTALLVATAKVEEAENLVRFGDPYREYMARTRSFIPFVL